jgi:hypothetical protein
MPDKFKNIIKSFTEKGSATRPDKDQSKKIGVAKEKHKTFSTYGGYGEVYKGKDSSGNKVKESFKTYKNPLNQEQVSVRKRKENGQTVSKEVTRDRYEGMGPMHEPIKEAIGMQNKRMEETEKETKPMSPPSMEKIGGEAGKVGAEKVIEKAGAESNEDKAKRLIENIKKSQSQTEESLKKAEKYKNAMKSAGK